MFWLRPGFTWSRLTRAPPRSARAVARFRSEESFCVDGHHALSIVQSEHRFFVSPCSPEHFGEQREVVAVTQLMAKVAGGGDAPTHFCHAGVEIAAWPRGTPILA